MFVCVCNSLRGRDLRRVAEESGETEPEAVYQLLGKAPVCGRCLGFAREFLLAVGRDKGLRSADFARQRPDMLDGDTDGTIDSRA